MRKLGPCLSSCISTQFDFLNAFHCNISPEYKIWIFWSRDLKSKAADQEVFKKELQL